LTFRATIEGVLPVGDATAAEDSGGLIDVSALSLHRLLDEVDESSLARTLRRLVTSADTDAGQIAAWGSKI
jgi:FXSXX-COOH protein